MKRRVAIIGAVTGTIVETAAHRRVAAKAEFGQHRRAVGTEAIAPGAIDRRGNDEPVADRITQRGHRSEEHTSELQSLMRISYAVFCLKKKKEKHIFIYTIQHKQKYTP